MKKLIIFIIYAFAAANAWAQEPVVQPKNSVFKAAGNTYNLSCYDHGCYFNNTNFNLPKIDKMDFEKVQLYSSPLKIDHKVIADILVKVIKANKEKLNNNYLANLALGIDFYVDVKTLKLLYVQFIIVGSEDKWKKVLKDLSFLEDLEKELLANYKITYKYPNQKFPLNDYNYSFFLCGADMGWGDIKDKL